MMGQIVVVFPAPLRPTRQTSSPAATDRLMPLRIRLLSMSTFRFDRLSISRPSRSPEPNVLSLKSFLSLLKFWASSHDRGNHRWIGKERVGRHVAKDRACLQGDDAMRVPLDEVHVVLDLHDGAHARRLGGRDQNF